MRRMQFLKQRFTHVFILFTWLFVHSFSDGYADCPNNTIEFVSASEEIHNPACGNSGFQQITGSTPTGTSITYGWEASYDGGPFVTVTDGSNPLTGRTISKNDITDYIIGIHSPKSATYRIRRAAYSSSAFCGYSNLVYLYYVHDGETESPGIITNSNSSNVCQTAIGASGTLTVNRQSGRVLRWEYFNTDPAVNDWVDLGNNDNPQYNYSGITTTTRFRTVVEAVCPPGGTLTTEHTITVTPPPTISIPPPSNISACGGLASISIVGTASSFQWQVNDGGGYVNIPGATSSTLNLTGLTTAMNGYKYHVILTSSPCTPSLTSTEVTLTVSSAPAPPEWNGHLSLCANGSSQSLTATVTVTSGSVVWYTLPTGGTVVSSPTLTSTAPTSVTYYAEAVNSTGCPSAERTAVNLAINPRPAVPVAPTVAPICEDGVSHTLTATANPVAGVSFVWYDDPIAGNVVTNPSLTSTTATSVTYYAEAKNNSTNCTSANRTPVTLTINPRPLNPVIPAVPPVCEDGTFKTLTATANAVTGVNVVWYDALTNGNIVSSSITSTTPISRTIYAQAVDATTGCISESRTPVTLTITAAPNPPALAAGNSGAITECQTSPIQTLNANNALASTTGVTWYTAATGGTVVASPILNTVGTVTYYAQYSNGTCSSTSRTPVILTINAAPVAPALSGSASITECQTSPSQTLNANNALSSTAGVTWYTAATGGTVVATPTLNTVGTVTYFAQATNATTGCLSLSRTAVTLTINAAPAAPTVSAANITECETSPVQTLNANAVITSSVPVSWYTSATGGTVVASPTLSNAGNVTYYAEAVSSTTNCSSLSRTAVTLTINPAPTAPALSGSATITQCETSPIQTLNANNALASTTGVTWYTAASGGSAVASPTLNTIGTVTYYAQASNATTGCLSLSRTAVTLIINAAPVAPALSGSASITECQTSPIQTLNANNALSSTTGVRWYTAATGGTVVTSPTLNTVGTITYYAEAVSSSTNCSSLSRTAVILTINPAPTAPALSGSATIIQCQTSPTQTLNANNALSSTTNVSWFTSATGGTPITSPTLNTIGSVTYYAEATNTTSGCLSLTRTAVTLTINAAPPAPALSGSSTIIQCETSPIQTLDARAAFASPTGILWYTTASGGTAITSPTLNSVGSITYYAEAINNTSGCLSLSRTAITLTIKPRPAVTSVSNVIVCNNSTTTPITLSSNVPGSTFTWTNNTPSIGLAANGTGNIPSFLATNTTNGALTATITVTSTAEGCTGPARTFTITVPKPIITNSPLSQEICSGTNSTAVVLTSNTLGATFEWSVSSATGVSGHTQLSGTGTIPVQTLYATGTNTGIIVYTISATANGCQGPTKEYVINVLPLPTPAQTYGDPTKRYNINTPAPLKGNQAIIGTGKWSQSSGPNMVLINDPTNFETEISGHIPGTYEFKWTISNKICVSEKALTLAVNAPPVPRNDAYDERVNTPINGNVSTNDTDPDGTVLTFIKVSDPASGTIQFNTDGSFIYVPAPNFTGTETFKYEACDVDGACVEATVTLSNYPPTVVHLTPAQSDVFEGGKVWITARLESPIHEDVTITLSYGGDVTNGDYSLSGNLTLTIKAGQTTTSERVQILAVRDGIKEIDETLLVDINLISSKYVDKGTGSEVIIHDVFPTDDPPSGKDENPDIRPDPMTSPNNDGVGNDEFFIYNISAYPDNEVKIFNRWGNEVFRMKNYDNYDKAFRGKANTGILANTQQELVDGVYYYLIYTKTPGNATKLNKGYFILKRKK